MKKIECLIVDDEPPAREILEKYISSVSFLNLAGTADNAIEAITFLQNHSVDLLFIDIEMPGLLGTDFIRIIKNPPKAIFTTAYKKFALEGFELDAVDYLLKPFSFDRFLKAVNKATGSIVSHHENKTYYGSAAIAFKAFITVRADRKNLKIPLNSILFIERFRDYVKIVTDSKTIMSKQPLSSLESILPAEAFIRIHRSFIVAIDRIESYTYKLIGIGNYELPISRLYRHEVQKILGDTNG